ELAIDAGADEPALEHVLEKILVFALLAANDRSEDQEAGPFGKGENATEDLLARLRGDGPAALRAMPLADAREQYAQVIVDFRDGADRGPGIFVGRFLLNADGRGETREVID